MGSASRHIVYLTVLILFMLTGASHGLIRCRTTQGASWTGNVELKHDIIRADVHSFYLDVEEEIILSPAGNAPNHDSTTLEIYGTFSLPTEAVITGVLIWDGETILKGKLKPRDYTRLMYEEVVDRDRAEPPMPHDPVVIEWMSGDESDNTYEITVYPVVWGQGSRLRVRYLLPQSFENQQLVIPIPTPFGDNVSIKPEKFELELKKGDTLSSIILEKEGSFLKRSLPVTMFGFYDGEKYRIVQAADQVTLASTSFSEGPWTGNYLLFWGQVPDHLIQRAGLSMEIVFLWRWNNWNSFVRWSGSNKSVSSHGQQAINQAKQIKNATLDIVSGTGKVGLVLDRGDSAHNREFPVGGARSRALDSLVTFLNGINSNYLLSTIAGNRIKTEWQMSASEREAMYKKGVSDFEISLQHAYNLYSPLDNVIKHLIIITVGPKIVNDNSYEFFTFPDYFQGITVTGYGNDIDYPTGYWPGVPIDDFVGEHGLFVEGYTTNGYLIPPFKEANFTVQLSNESKSYLFDIFGRTVQGKLFVDEFYFSGHADAEWSPLAEWEAYSKDGTLLATYVDTPFNYIQVGDSCIAKMWAGAQDPYSEEYHDEGLGVIYGFVDESYSLVALPDDTVGAALNETLQDEGVPFLTDLEIFQPPLAVEPTENTVSGKNRPGISLIAFSAISRVTTIDVVLMPGQTAKLKIYDSMGRMVAFWDLNGGHSVNTILWDGRTLSRGVAGRGMFICVLEIGASRYQKTFVRM